MRTTAAMQTLEVWVMLVSHSAGFLKKGCLREGKILGWKEKMGGRKGIRKTHNRPKKNVQTNAHFLLLFICSLQIHGTGKSSTITSVAIFTAVIL